MESILYTVNLVIHLQACRQTEMSVSPSVMGK